MRDCEGKLRIDLVPLECIQRAAAVLTHGAKKYAVRNWQLGLPLTQVYASMMRHLGDATEYGALDDGEGGSNLPHIDLFLTNAIMLHWLYHNRLEAFDLDLL